MAKRLHHCRRNRGDRTENINTDTTNRNSTRRKDKRPRRKKREKQASTIQEAGTLNKDISLWRNVGLRMRPCALRNIKTQLNESPLITTGPPSTWIEIFVKRGLWDKGGRYSSRANTALVSSSTFQIHSTNITEMHCT